MEKTRHPLLLPLGRHFLLTKIFFIYIFLWQMHMIIAEAVPALRKSVADTLPDWIESPLYNTSGTDSYKSVKIWSIRSTKHSLLQGTICTAWQVYAELMVFVQCEMNSVTVKNMKRKNVWYVLHMKTVRMVMFTTDKCKYHGCKMAKEEVESRLYLETSQKWQIMITMTQ